PSLPTFRCPCGPSAPLLVKHVRGFADPPTHIVSPIRTPLCAPPVNHRSPTCPRVLASACPYVTVSSHPVSPVPGSLLADPEGRRGWIATAASSCDQCHRSNPGRNACASRMPRCRTGPHP